MATSASSPAPAPPPTIVPAPPAPVAIRGDRMLAEGELKAHMIQLFRLENIGVLLGAGASKGAGGMLVSELWAYFAATFRDDVQWCLRQNFLDADFPKTTPNIEKFSDQLMVAESEWERTANRHLPDLRRAITAVQRTVIKAARLDESLWKDPLGDAARATLTDHRRLLTRLVASRQPGQPLASVFTVNYDMALEWAAESLSIEAKTGFLGLHNRRFSPQTFDLVPRNTLARGEASLGSYAVGVVKLHGSLSWRVLANGDVQEKSTGSLNNAFKGFIDGTTPTLPAHLIYPSSAKFRQTIQYVFGELFRRFTEFLSQPQSALIVCGYSFCDDHLNRIILAGLLNPTLQVVVYYRDMEIVDGRLAMKASAPSSLKELFGLNLPRVTFVGGGDLANFSKMTSDLPDPATVDDPALETDRLLKLLRSRP